MDYSLLLIFLYLAVWLCLKMSSKNMVLVRLLHIGAMDLTVFSVVCPWDMADQGVTFLAQIFTENLLW